jgi:DNA-directed RNA polymerase subunit beta'
MLAPNNFLSPATGEPIIQPTQDMLLGCYYLTIDNRPKIKGSNQYFGCFEDVIFAYTQKQIDLHSYVWVRCLEIYDFIDEHILLKTRILEDGSVLKFYKNLQVRESSTGEFLVQYLRTTPGRIIFNQNLNTLVTM